MKEKTWARIPAALPIFVAALSPQWLAGQAEEVGAWWQRLAEAGFDIAVRKGNLRNSPHLHSTHEDIVKLVGVLST